MELATTHPSGDVFVMGKELTVNKLTGIGSKIREFISANPEKNLVLDFSGTYFIDSSSISLLLNVDKNMKATGRKCYILRPSATVLEILERMNLTSVFSVVSNCNEIVSAPSSLTVFEQYLPYTIEESGFRRLSCICPLCSSADVIGYLVDTNAFSWQWEGELLLPTVRSKVNGAKIEYFNLLPIICLECNMCSTDPRHFHVSEQGKVVVSSNLESTTITALAKGVKRRRQIMDQGKITDDRLFRHPRSAHTTVLAYILAAECARVISIRSFAACPYTVGSLYYYAFALDESVRHMETAESARAWLTRVPLDKDKFEAEQLAQTYFMLANVSLIRRKIKEASTAVTELEQICAKASPESSTSLFHPAFWLKGAKMILAKHVDDKE